MSETTLNRILITAVGDTACDDDAKRTFQNIVNENPDVNLFLGDSSYKENAICFIDIIKSHSGLKEKTIFSVGNHDDKEDGSDTVKEQLESYFEITDWTFTKQVRNVYIINMNSQDPDWDLKNKDQYNWVKAKLEDASRLMDVEKTIDWMIVMVHKPLYTLKGGHARKKSKRHLSTII